MVIVDMGQSEKQVPEEKSMNEISTEEHLDEDIYKKDNLVTDPASLQRIVKSIEQTTTDSNPSDKTAREECSQCVSEELCDVHKNIQTKSIRRPSSANVECQQLILECRVLTDLNESLRRDNESLNTVNRMLQSNYDMLKERLEIVESEHRLRLSQLDNANELLNRSLKLQTKKRSRSDEYDNYSRPLVPYNKRRKFDDERGAKDSKTVAAGNISGSSKAESVEMEPDQFSTSNNSAANNNETNETEELDRSDVKSDNLSGTNSDSDVEFIESPAPVIIDLGDTSDDNDDYGTDKENDDCDPDASQDESQNDDDANVECDFLKPLSEYVRFSNAVQNQTSK